jgi:Zn-dependent M28 family amino/carboxypeptidase
MQFKPWMLLAVAVPLFAADTAPVPVQKAMDAFSERAIRAHVKFLSSDLLEGRGPGTRGDALATQYIASQFEALGLQPFGDKGSFFQKVSLLGITFDPDKSSLGFQRGSAPMVPLKYLEEFVGSDQSQAISSTVDSEVIFVGHGVVAPEYNWDDYKGIDVKGKTLVMLVNDPPVRDPSNPGELDAKTFGGGAMTYYGRWTYKYEIGAQKGAAGVLLIHETEPAGYPFDVVQSKVAEQFDLVTPDKNMGRVSIEGWITLDQGRNLLKMAGQDFDTLKRQAATREFKPVPLDVRASMSLRNKLRTVDSKNVVAKLEGRDPKLKDEYVIYTAHWDHLGVGPAVNGDTIYNGAKDNASGTAGIIEIARAFTKLAAPPKRSILFLSVTAEEQGLLGSQYYSVTPLYPLSKTLANINLDGLNLHGRTKDLTLIGYGASELDDYARDAAGEQGRVVRGDAEPEKGFYYRSDHFNFAKMGVPALDPDEGIDYIGKPPEFGEKVRNEYTEHDYHKPSDVVKADWDLSGAREDLKLFFAVGYRVAEADRYPEWKAGNEFKAIRDASLKSGT